MTTEFRVFRTFKWVRDPSREVRYGGGPPAMLLEHTDTLQTRTAPGDWADVPIVEAEKPPHPHQKPDRFPGIRRSTGMQR